MDLLLTPLVTRLLKQYVKRSSEGAGRDLKVGAVPGRPPWHRRGIGSASASALWAVP